MTDVAQMGAKSGLRHNFRDNGDATYAEEYSSQLRAWDPTSLAFVKVIVDHATGSLSVLSGGGGGGAVTVADGADVAQGTTTDLSSASTVVGLLKAIKAAITGTLTTNATVGNFPATQAVSIASMPSTPVTGPLTDTQLRALAVPVSGTVTATTGGLTDTQLRATAVPVSLASAPSTPVTGTFWQATQPVSVSGTLTVDPSGVTSPVSVASLPLPSGAATNVSVLDASTRIREMAFSQWLAHEEALFQ